jgi:hypothetical protein
MQLLPKNGKPLKATGLNKAMDLMRVPDARLVKMHVDGSPTYYIVPGGYVGPSTAEKIKSHPKVTASEDGMFPGHSQTWKINSTRGTNGR